MNGGLPDKYYLCIIYIYTYSYNSLELLYRDSQFIYKYRVIDRT